MLDRKHRFSAAFAATAFVAALLSVAADPADAEGFPVWHAQGAWESLKGAEAHLLGWIQECRGQGGQYQGSLNTRTTAQGKQYQAWLDCHQ